MLQVTVTEPALAGAAAAVASHVIVDGSADGSELLPRSDQLPIVRS